MEARPILFNTQMVQALLEGRKTQTRRVVKPQPEYATVIDHEKRGGEKVWIPYHRGHSCMWQEEAHLKCPYGKIGDLLWVRETFCREPSAVNHESYEESEVGYKADNDPSYLYEDGHEYKPKWKPSIFMPKWASRLTLEITHIRVERLKDIMEHEAQAEGVEEFDIDWSNLSNAHKIDSGGQSPTFKGGFIKIWDKIHGKESWDSINPWVWVIEFKVHKKNFQEILHTQKEQETK